MVQAVIFDFDGVIADSEPLHCQAFIDVLERRGVELTVERYYSDYLGYTDAECIEAVCRDAGVEWDPATRGAVLREKLEAFEGLVRDQNALIEGVLEFVAMLRENRVPLAVCSGALRSDIDLMLEGSDLATAFDVIVTADDVANGKPDPEGFELARRRLEEHSGGAVAAGRCVVVEDSFWGLEAAKAAGMRTIAVSNTYTKEELADKADRVVTRLDGLGMEDLRRLCEGDAVS